MTEPQNICMAAAEVAPYAKTGGLADVTAALARYLHRAGHDVRLFLPLYQRIARQDRAFVPVDYLQHVPVAAGPHQFDVSVFTTPLPDSDLSVYLVHCSELYDRPGIYCPDGDEHVRFAVLARAALECCQRMGFAPDIVHAHDWHTALLPLYVKALYSWDRLFAATRSVLTIHNIGYQGTFGADTLDVLGLASCADLLHQEDLHAGRVNFMKTGILYADALTTVSHTYSREIQTETYGVGLHHMLQARHESLVGIVNGVDEAEWNPAVDELIPARYSAADLSGKATCQSTLLEELGLQPDPTGPVLGMVSRLTKQKGIELLFEPLPWFLRHHDLRVVVLGSGDPAYEHDFAELQRMFPGRVCYYQGYSNPLAHRIEAGADVFLMPSLFEPCGLNQMYSLKYGTAPIVRRTGGLADTVEHFDPEQGTGTGFVFDHYSADGFHWALGEALRAYGNPAAWQQLVANGMAKNYSWQRQVREYEKLYRLLRG